MTEPITEAVRQRAADLLAARRRGGPTSSQDVANARVEVDMHVDVLTALCQAIEESEKA